MSVVVLQVFVSLMLVAIFVLLFVASVRGKDHEHADRLSLIPLEDDAPAPAPAPAAPTSPAADPTSQR